MTNGNLHTIFLDFRGGTYVSQIRSTNPLEALKDWAKSLPEEDLHVWQLRRDDLIRVIQDGSLIPLADCLNVWCLAGVGKGDELILLNVVTTAAEPID